MDEISPALVDFSKNVFELGKRYHERNNAKKDLVKHLDKVKNMPGRVKRKSILKDLEKVEEKMTKLIDKERNLVDLYPYSDKKSRDMKKEFIYLRDQFGKERQENEKLETEVEFKDALLVQNKDQLKELAKDLKEEKKARDHIELREDGEIKKLRLEAEDKKKQINELKKNLRTEIMEKEKVEVVSIEDMDVLKSTLDKDEQKIADLIDEIAENRKSGGDKSSEHKNMLRKSDYHAGEIQVDEVTELKAMLKQERLDNKNLINQNKTQIDEMKKLVSSFKSKLVTMKKKYG